LFHAVQSFPFSPKVKQQILSLPLVSSATPCD
jgi:hypothetical protein